MTDPDEDKITDAITENAQGPKSAQGDGGSIQQHSIADQIAAADYLANRRAVARGGLGIRMTKLSPPGNNC